MADFSERFSGAYRTPNEGFIAGREYSISKTMGGSSGATLAGRMLGKTQGLIDPSFPIQGTPQGAHEGSQSSSPDKTEGNMPGSATQKAFQSGKYKNGTYSPDEP